MGHAVAMRFARRGMLLAAAATLAGCAPSTTAHSPPRATATTTPRPTAAPSTHSSTASKVVSPSPSSTGLALPSRAAIIAEFSGQVPEQWGMEVDGVVLRTASAGIALTFDACGGPHGSDYDEALVATLIHTGTPATLFLNSRWIEANPATTRALAANPLFELANHGTRHVPLSVTGNQAYGITGTASVAELYDEVAENQELLTGLMGTPPRFFRSGTAHLDDVAAQVVRAMGLVPVNFDVNADAGATFSASQVYTATTAATAGSISIGHVNQPGSGTAAGIAQAIPALREAGASFVTLGEALA